MKKIIITLVLLSCISTFGQTKKTTKTTTKKTTTEQPKKQTTEAPVPIEASQEEVKTEGNENEIFYGLGQTETLPVFPDCELETPETNLNCFKEKLSNHITSNLQYPKDAKAAGIEGEISVIFDINKEGDVEIVNTLGFDPVFQEEGKRIISLLPKMKPATIKGKPVKMRFTIPVQFKLN
jgi:periplasmic protein TonB